MLQIIFMQKAVLLLSGGLDSATTGAVAKSLGFELYALSFDYGQRHSAELKAAEKIADFLKVRQHHVVNLDLSIFGGSALTSNDIAVPKDKDLSEIGQIAPVTYVPARNTVFLSVALSYAESISAEDIFIGISNVDSSGYPDCTPDFLDKFQQLANAGTVNKNFRIHAPLLFKSKADTIRWGLSLGVPYNLTLSCYDPSPNGSPCQRCEACLLRQKGFSEIGIYFS